MQNQQQNQVPAAAQPVALPPLPQWQQDANALGLNAEERELHRILCGVHNFTVGQYSTLREEGYGTIYELRNWKHKDIHKLLSNISNRPVNRGGQRYGDKRIRQLQGFTWFVNDSYSRGVPVDLYTYEVDPDICIHNAVLAADHAEDSTAADKPEKFTYKDWITWEESVEVYLESVISSTGAPLSYVVRKDLPVGTAWNTLDEVQQRVYTPSVEGFAFNIDSKTVLTLIKELCLGTESEVWIKGIKCGRQAMKALRAHYDGPDEARKRTLESKAKLKTLFYKHEYTFSFEKFITALQRHFKVLERYNMPMYEHEKVEALFDKCQNSNPEFKLELGICRSQHDTFIGAITYLKTTIARIFPSDGSRKGVGKQRIISSATSVNGVDLTDFSKRYTAEEVRKLKSTADGKKAWYAFLNNPKRKKATAEFKKRGSDSNRKIQALEKRLKIAEDAVANSTGSSASDAQKMNDGEQRIVAATINGVINASRHNAQIQFPVNGRSASIRSAQRSQSGGASVTSEVTFDHFGNPL